jgi:hypothetical protein
MVLGLIYQEGKMAELRRRGAEVNAGQYEEAEEESEGSGECGWGWLPQGRGEGRAIRIGGRRRLSSQRRRRDTFLGMHFGVLDVFYTWR